MREHDHRPPTVILGLDAGDPFFIERWAKDGHLPNIASIMAQGAWGRTAGPELISEHGAWVSIFSGLSRSRHGYYFFRQLVPHTYDLRSFTGRDVQAAPFWSFLQGTSKKVAIIDAPDCPLVPDLAGIQLANWGTHNNWDPHHYPMASAPAELLHEVSRTFGSKRAALENHESGFREDREIHRALLNRIRTKGSLCRELVSRDAFDLIVTVFAESHVAGHQFWKYTPEVPGNLGAPEHELTHAIRDVYRAIDAEVGLLLERLPRDSNVLVLSSVGMEDMFPTTGLARAFCRELGYQTPASTGGPSLNPLHLARRILPEAWRVRLSRRLPRETRERLLASQFRSSADWGKTVAFAIPSLYTSLFRVNLRGREPQGVVSSHDEYPRCWAVSRPT